MKLSIRQNALALFIAVFLFGCASQSSHLIVGNTHPPIESSQVRIYSEPPGRFEKIAMIDSNSSASFKFSQQGKLDAALERLKEEAAKLGANGIIIGNVGSDGSMAVGTATASGNTAFGTAFSAGGLIRTLNGLAIYVPPAS